MSLAVLSAALHNLAATAALLNPGFEAARPDSRPVGWTIIDKLDPHRYGPPDLKFNFDPVRPVVATGGYQSAKGLAFPAEGTWFCPVFNHRNGGNRGIDGRGTGKAAAYQTVILEPGRYRFTARLRTADGDFYSAGFSLGCNFGEAAKYANDNSTGIRWTGNLATRSSELRGLSERGEWAAYSTEVFSVREKGPVTVWIRFNYGNENQFRARWQVDDAAIVAEHIEARATVQHPPCPPLKTAFRWREFAGHHEPHLVNPAQSSVVDAPEIRLFRKARLIPAGTSVAYRFGPVDLRESAFLLAMLAGEATVEANGKTYRATGREPRTYSTHEWRVAEGGDDRRPRILTVTIRASGKEAVRLYELEIGPATRTAIRLAKVEANVAAAPWVLGAWDATANEFLGEGEQGPQVIAVPNDGTGSATEPTSNQANLAHWSRLRPIGRWDIRFHHQPTASHRYYLVHGLLDGKSSLDIGGDGLVEWLAETKGEEIVDFEVTDLLKEGENRVVLETTGQHDFAALVEICPGSDKTESLRLAFGGDELAERLTRVADNTWFWLRELHYEPSGFIDASVPRGHWFNQYWPVDIAFALREWVRWGRHEETLPTAALVSAGGWHGHNSNRSGSTDNTAGNILVLQLCEILRRADGQLSPELEKAIWQRIEAHCEEVVTNASGSPFGLVRGTNWENAGNREHGPCYALSTTLGAAAALRKAARLADGSGKEARATRWDDTAKRLRAAVLTNLVLAADHRCPSGFVLPQQTWAYGRRLDGAIEDRPLAGYFWAAGDWMDETGLVVEDQELLRIYDRTLGAALPLFQQSNRRVVSGYAASYDGPDAALVLAALCDRVDAFDLLLEQLARQTDVREDRGTKKGELSRWAYGPPGEEEDTNLVCAAGFLWALRALAGIDDLLADNRQLRLVPRLPRRWDRIRVNDWPVRCRDANGREQWTSLSYEFLLENTRANLKLRTGNFVPNLEIRLGPFPKTTNNSRAEANGKPVPGRLQHSGDATWVWLRCDSGPAETIFRVETANTERQKP